MGISHKLAQEKVSEWIKTRWFAPQSYRKLSTAKQDITGVYLPFWSFDAQVKCRYTGERGTKKPEARDKSSIDPATDYEWRFCAGHIVSSLRDILVPTSEHLSPELQSRFDWKLDRLVAFDPRFLAGYRSEIAQIQLSRAHAQARSVMEKKLQGEICSEIGGEFLHPLLVVHPLGRGAYPKSNAPLSPPYAPPAGAGSRPPHSLPVFSIRPRNSPESPFRQYVIGP